LHTGENKPHLWSAIRLCRLLPRPRPTRGAIRRDGAELPRAAKLNLTCAAVINSGRNESAARGEPTLFGQPRFDISLIDLLLIGAQRLFLIAQQLANDAGFGVLGVIFEKVTERRFFLFVRKIPRGLKPRIGHGNSPCAHAGRKRGGGPEATYLATE
jgi:hypothetical protein